MRLTFVVALTLLLAACTTDPAPQPVPSPTPTAVPVLRDAAIERDYRDANHRNCLRFVAGDRDQRVGQAEIRSREALSVMWYATGDDREPALDAAETAVAAYSGAVGQIDGTDDTELACSMPARDVERP